MLIRQGLCSRRSRWAKLGLPRFRESAWGLGLRRGFVGLGSRVGRLKLTELGKRVGGPDYAVVSKALARFGERLSLDASLRKTETDLQEQLSKDKTQPKAFSAGGVY